MRRKSFILSILLMAVLVLTSCSNSNQASQENDREEIILTIEELAEYNGKDGKPAYIAVDGVIYDVTNSSLWGQGDHNGFEAGGDLTEGIKNESPHGLSVLSRIPVVGKIAD